MRVAVDAHAIGTGAGGNETYVRALLAALRDHDGDVEPVALQCNDSIERGETVAGVETVAIPFGGGALRAFGIARAAKRARADLLHAQYFVSPMYPVPSVVSVHDVAWRECPETLPPLLRFRLEATMGGSIRRARRVLVLTEAVKAEVVRHYSVSPDRVDVVAPFPDPIYCADVSDERVDNVRTKYGLPSTFIFYAGALQPRKNLVRLARAAAAIPDGPPLVIAGPRVWGATPVRRGLERGAPGNRLRILGYVDRVDLPLLMRAATIVAYVPVYEGFGLPVLEALAAGAPVLASDIASLREVAGDAAQFADPRDEEAVRHGIKALLTDAALRNRLTGAGPVRSGQFTAQSMAIAASRAYRAALES